MLQQLELKIRRIGAIPVKSNKGDPITWMSPEEAMKLKNIVPFKATLTTPPPHKGHNQQGQNGGPKNETQKVLVPVTLTMKPGKGLGCIICKGPPEFPGIFVQRVKPQGLALEGGLEPGDQILECNGLQFNSAVGGNVVFLSNLPLTYFA